MAANLTEIVYLVKVLSRIEILVCLENRKSHHLIFPLKDTGNKFA